MTASITDFLANFQGGGARPNRYEVILSFPSAVPFATDAANKIKFTCKTAAIPASNMGVIDVPYKGRNAKVPGDKVWDDWNVTILLDNDYLGRGVFESWHNLILGFNSNVASNGFMNPANAFANATVNLLDRHDQIRRSYRVEGMFPTLVGEVTLGYDQNDMISEQPVTFAINGWTSDATD